MTELTHPNPYGRAALAYYANGWTNPLPIAGKFPPPKGYTGYDGHELTYADVQSFIDGLTPGRDNVGLRLPRDIVGIDVDDYDGKVGGQTLAKAEARLGALPGTIMSTSRGAGQRSGIRLYRVPRDATLGNAQSNLKAAFGPDIDILHHGHRYAMVWPSVHPRTGDTYQWFTAGGDLIDAVPHIDQAATLPEAWVDFLTATPTREQERPRFDDPFGAPEGHDNPHEGVIPVGQRDQALYEYACLMRGKGHTEREIAALVTERWKDCAQPAGNRYELREALAKVRQAMKFAPEPEALSLVEAASEPGEAKSWGKVDLMDMLSGNFEPALPTMLTRSDGHAMLYHGLVHAINGESESGKSWIAQHETAQRLKAGEPVLYIDAESDAMSIIDRLRKMGCTDEQIMANLDYRHPEGSPRGDLLAWQEMMGNTYALAVIDGVTDSLGLWNFSINENDEVARWMREFPRQLADKTGAAVVLIDHVTKSTEGRGRFAIGAQAKMAGLNGAAFTVDVREPLAVGKTGRLTIKVAKDRPGRVRAVAAPGAGKDRTQHVADFVLESSEDGAVSVNVYPPTEATNGSPSMSGAQRAEGAIIEYVRDTAPGGLESKENVVKGVYGRHQDGMFKLSRDQIRAGLTNLIAVGQLVVQDGPHRSKLVRLGTAADAPFGGTPVFVDPYAG